MGLVLRGEVRLKVKFWDGAHLAAATHVKEQCEDQEREDDHGGEDGSNYGNRHAFLASLG